MRGRSHSSYKLQTFAAKACIVLTSYCWFINSIQNAKVIHCYRPVVSSTRFKHPERHLVTRFFADRRTRNQIEHMLMRSRWVSFVIDCRAYNRAHTGSKHGSDHATVRARLRLRMKTASISNRPARLDTAKLKTAVLDHLRLNLRNCFAA